jgi:hypothetical protein
MSGSQRKPTLPDDGYKPKVTPRPSIDHRPSNVQGGYQPTTGQGTSTPPASVPNQPSSVQPPKK